MRVCVFCASAHGLPEVYLANAAAVGTALGEAGHDLVYGGGNVSTMGAVSRAVKAAGGHVTGVLPELFRDRSVDDDTDEVLVTATMRDRKLAMGERADAFVVLPGGIGTLEELMEVLTLKHLGEHDDPIVLVDVRHRGRWFWQPWLDWLHLLEEDGFTTPQLRDRFTVVRGTDGLLDALGG
jgi:uncharacterized protein (TIGR00730 family)